MSVHAYSQLWMLPYGYTTSRPADYKDQMRVARAATEALRAVHGTSYRYGPINEVIYQVRRQNFDSHKNGIIFLKKYRPPAAAWTGRTRWRASSTPTLLS